MLRKKTYADEKGMAGMNLATYRLRKKDPGSMRLKELWPLLKAAGITDEEKSKLI